MPALMTLLGAMLLIYGLIVYSSLSCGWVCFKFWTWFIVPVFPFFNHINYWQAVGLMFFIGLFRNHSSNSLKEDLYQESKVYRATSTLITPWVILGIAWLIKETLM